MNTISLVGRITKDIELKKATGNNGDFHYTIFVLAVNRQRKDEPADFIQCIASGKTAENLVKYCKKGSRVGLTGSIRTGQYKDKNGNTVYTMQVACSSIEFLDSKEEKTEEDYGLPFN